MGDDCPLHPLYNQFSESPEIPVVRSSRYKPERGCQRSQTGEPLAHAPVPSNVSSCDNAIHVFFLRGAAGRDRTADLVLTKDVLYQLSHSSKLNRPTLGFSAV
jgi:hypothetical protein